MHARTLWVGLALISLFVSTSCSNVVMVSVPPGVDAAEERAAVFACCRSAGLRPHEEVNLKMDAILGSYGQQIRADPELVEIYSDEFSEVRIYAREGRYELDVESTSSVDDLAAEIDGCLGGNLPESN